MKQILTIFLLTITTINTCLVARHHDHFVSRNFDFPLGGKDGLGQVIFNPMALYHRSFKFYPDDKPLEWIAKYNSLTINLLAKNFPQDGFNTEGLTVHVTVLRNYLHKKSVNIMLPTITEMDIIQYILDNAASTDEAINLFIDPNTNQQLVRLTKINNVFSEDEHTQLNMHWAICDITSECAELEFIGGKFIYRKYSNDETFVLTNNFTPILEKEYERIQNHDDLPLDEKFLSKQSFPRYTNARFLLEHLHLLHGVSIEEKGFYLLDQSTITSWNKWQSVIDMKNRTMFFRSQAERSIKKVNLDIFNRSMKIKQLAFDLHYDLDDSFKDSNELSFEDFHEIDLNKELNDLIDAIILMNRTPKLGHAIYEHNNHNNSMIYSEKSYIENYDIYDVNEKPLFFEYYFRITKFIGKIMLYHFKKALKYLLNINDTYWCA